MIQKLSKLLDLSEKQTKMLLASVGGLWALNKFRSMRFRMQMGLFIIVGMVVLMVGAILATAAITLLGVLFMLVFYGVMALVVASPVIAAYTVWSGFRGWDEWLFKLPHVEDDKPRSATIAAAYFLPLVVLLMAVI